MAAQTHTLDLGSLRLASGEGRRLELTVGIEPLELGAERYEASPRCPTMELEVSRMVGQGYALRLRFEAALAGPCMRCLGEAAPMVVVDAREVDKPTDRRSGAPPQDAGVGEELSSPYVHDEKLDLGAWARDAFALSAPVQVLCREDCAGLCPVCAANLNDLDPAGPGHTHEREPDPRWAKLGELHLE